MLQIYKKGVYEWTRENNEDKRVEKMLSVGSTVWAKINIQTFFSSENKIKNILSFELYAYIHFTVLKNKSTFSFLKKMNQLTFVLIVAEFYVNDAVTNHWACTMAQAIAE